MSKFNNYLSLPNTSGEEPYLLDYQHAKRLFVDDNQARAPKFGFQYYVQFIINSDFSQLEVDRNIGLFVKKIDLPKFSFKTETINQYNRKTHVHTGLTYSPISIEFHDDASNITTQLWESYYRSLVADSNYNQRGATVPKQYKDTKFGDIPYEYGMYQQGKKDHFFDRIDIYLLNHSLDNHSLISLINPKISEWRHDSVNQSESAKVLQNSMTVVYENVLYYKGSNNPNIPGFVNEFYDPTPSPLKVAGSAQNDPGQNVDKPERPGNAAIFDRSTLPQQQGNPLFDKAGLARSYNVPKRVESTFDRSGAPRLYGHVNPPYRSNNQLLDLAAILAKDYVNQNGLGRVGPRGYNIASSALNYSLREPAGKFYEQPARQYNPGILNLPGGFSVNVFKGLNKTVDGKTVVNPSALLFPPKR